MKMPSLLAALAIADLFADDDGVAHAVVIAASDATSNNDVGVVVGVVIVAAYALTIRQHSHTATYDYHVCSYIT